MTVLDFLRLSRRNWRTLAVGLVLGLLVAGGYTLLQPKVYQASSAGYVVPSGQGDIFGASEAALSRAASYAQLITSKPVFEAIAANPELDLQGESLEGRLSAEVAPNSTLLVVTASAPSGQSAAALANGALQAMAEVIGEIEGQVGSSSQLLVIPLENATVPGSPVSPSLRLNLALGALAGLVVAYGYVFLRRATNVKVHTLSDLAAASGAGSLGRVPRTDVRGKKAQDIEAITGEAFRRLRTNLRFASVDREVRSVVITSANQGEGKSTVAASLAKVLAESGQGTVLIDGDLRRPRIGKLFDLDDRTGLSEVLSGQIALAEAIRATSTPGLYVLPAGRIPPNPSEMLGSETMRQIIAELSREQFVIVDAPPLLPVTDAAVVSTRVDGVLLIADAGQTRKDDVVAARATLDQVHARVLGTVLNRVRLDDNADGYEYRRNRYYYVQKGAQARAEDAAPVGAEASVPEAAQSAGSVPAAAVSPRSATGSDQAAAVAQPYGEGRARVHSDSPRRAARRGS